MINRLRHILNSSKYKGAANSDSYFGVNLESKNKLLPPGELSRTINASEIFNNERDNSKLYRIIQTLSPLFSNVLFNLSGDKGPSNFFTTTNNISPIKEYGYETFDGFVFKNDPYDNTISQLTYLNSLSKNLKEQNGWFGFYNPDIKKGSLCSFYDLEPTRDRFDLNSSLNIKNWEFTITYPYKSENTHHLVNGGLLITNAELVVIGGVNMISFGTAVPHNLNVGDMVRLTNMPNSSMNGDYSVITLGLNSDSLETFFVVNIDTTNAVFGNSFTTGRLKRLYYGNEVTYYFRKLKKVKSFETQNELSVNSYDCFPLAFSNTIYGDQNYQIVINEDIDISDLTDNLGRPLSELFLTIIKTDSDGMFTKTISGLDFENYPGNVGTQTIGQRSVSNIRKMHTINTPLAPFDSHVPLESDININDSEFYGDICEYSKFEAKETILTSVMHRFNTINRETTTVVPVTGLNINGPRNEGYIYNPHFMIKIRQFSNYTESGDANTVGIPDYAENLNDGTYLWRDLLPIGVNDGQEETLDYPFLNGRHYLHQNLCIYTRRQDPFGYFGLLYNNTLPNDFSGNSITNNFETKGANNEC